MDRDDEDAISISSRDTDEEEYLDRRAILAPAILSVIAALGGREGDTYVLGDEALGCLKDLKKFWRKDDTDDERTVARIFWEARVLPNDMVPILLETAGKGYVDHKCAIACLDIVTAMTWPIDLSEELKELDDELDKGTDYTQLLQSHLYYKAALLKPGVIQALLGIMLPCLAKDKKERKERDSQIINVVLHLFRNLAFIKDQPVNIYASSDQAELSSLQSRLINTFHETNVLELLLTIASNASSDPFLNKWNSLVLEIFYLLFRGVRPSSLAIDQTKRQQSTLSSLLEKEEKMNRDRTRNAASRHSRFGTTISVKLNTSKPATTTESAPANNNATTQSSHPSQTFVLHRQQALNKETGTIFDMRKRKVKKKTNQIDELGRQDNINFESLVILQDVARRFLRACFNPFLSSLLKDIKSERPKITEKDNIRLLYITKWFLDFFLILQSQEKAKASGDASTANATWDFGLVAEVLERGWIIWILKRMREAVEAKPKLWNELQAGLECLTQLLKLIDSMSSASVDDPELNEAADQLQEQLIYNGEVLDISIDSLRVYKEGVQSLTYLDASVSLAYTLLRMLERWSKGHNNMYVRKKARARKRKVVADAGDDDEALAAGIEDQEDDSDKLIQETIFTFEAFEGRFAHEEITHTLITYLSRYQEFSSPEQMKRIVNLLHRQAVRAKAEGLLFKVSSLNLFKSILSGQKSLPRDQPYKDLVALINYVLKKFFKAVEEEPLLVVEAFFPKNRGRWKQYSSWEPDMKEKAKRGRKGEVQEEDDKFPRDVYIKKGYSWSQELGIAVAYLVDSGQRALVDWAKEILTSVLEERQKVVDDTDGSSSSQLNLEDMDDDAVREAAGKIRGPSDEAILRMENYSIKNDTPERSEAATRNPHLKLLFRLLNFTITDQSADELEWYVPAALLPSGLKSYLNVINNFLETPIDLEGKKASQLIRKKRRSRRQRVAANASDEEQDAEFDAGINPDEEDPDDDEPQKKKAKKKKEKQVYKSAQFIEDSDVEYGDDDAFWEKERMLRERAERMANEGKSGTMRSHGTKKRKKRRGAENEDEAEGDEEGPNQTRRKRSKGPGSNEESVSDSDADMDVDMSDTEMRTISTPATTPPLGSEDQSAGGSPVVNSRSAGSKAKPNVKQKGKSKSKEKQDLKQKQVSKPKAAPKAKKPKPKPKQKIIQQPAATDDEDDGDGSKDEAVRMDADRNSELKKRHANSADAPRVFSDDEDEIQREITGNAPRRRGKLVLSDEE